MPTEAARRRNTEWARQRRERELDRLRKTAQRCPKRHGPGVCGALLETRIGQFGQTVIVCPWCERQRAGVCRHCSRPVVGQVHKALYCRDHRIEVARRQARASSATHHDDRLVKARQRYWGDAERRAARLRQKAAWRKANPEKVAAQKRRYIKKHRSDPKSAYARYHRRYRKKFQLHRRDLVHRLTARLRGPIPRCSECGGSTRWTPVPGCPSKPWAKCAKCCWPFELKRRRKTRAKLLRTAAAKFGLKPKPIPRPRCTVARGPGDERLCVTPGCDIVVSHRRKKCTKCRRRDAELAEQLLAPGRGRGRRTDLERGPAA